MAVVDVVVIGAGIAGAAVACELARGARVVALETEDVPGYHATGRSAALLTENYGNTTIRRLTIASRRFFEDLPPGFADHPVLAPRGVLWVGRADQRPSLDAALAAGRRLVPSIHRIEGHDARVLCPVLRDDYLGGAVFEPDAMDLDVHAIHQGFLGGFRRRGGELLVGAGVGSIRRHGGGWAVESRKGRFAAGVIVNAAGAWCDDVARRAGVPGIGLVPRRRTAFTFAAPDGVDARRWPLVLDVDERFYFKPESGRILGSPADETPTAPGDAQAEELDIAEAVDRIERASTLTVTRIEHRWAGLRSFVRDGSPVAGMDPEAPGFFWLAGQGGYGIMTAPALARFSAGLIVEGSVPADLLTLGLTAQDLSPQRLRP